MSSTTITTFPLTTTAIAERLDQLGFRLVREHTRPTKPFLFLNLEYSETIRIPHDFAQDTGNWEWRHLRHPDCYHAEGTGLNTLIEFLARG